MPARIALLLLLPLAAFAEPGPAPHEHRSDRHGHPLPPGAVARLGLPPAMSAFPWALGWSADGARFVTVDSAGVTVFDTATGRPVETQAVGFTGRSQYTPLARDGRLLFLLDGRTGVLYDTAAAATRTFALPAPFGDPDRRVYSLHLSADCRFLAGVASPPGMAGVAWRYDLAHGRFTRLLNDRADLRSARLAPDSRRLFATGGTAEPELTARDLVAGKELWTVRLRAVGLLRAVSGDGRRLAVSDRDGVRVFDSSDGKVVLTAPVDSTTPPGLWGIDLSPDGSHLAVAVDREVAVWDVAAGRVKHRLPHAARLVGFAPDGRSLVTVAAWVQKWDLDTGRPAYPTPLLNKPAGATMLRWSGDGRRLLTIWPGDRRGAEAEWTPALLMVWDVGRMEPVWRTTSTLWIQDAVLDRTGTNIRMVRGVGEYHIWPVPGPGPRTDTRLRKSIDAREQAVVDFLPDGRLLAMSVVGRTAEVDIYDPSGRAAGSHRVPLLADEQHMQYPRWPVVVTRGMPGVQLRPPGRRVDLTTGRPLPPLDTRGDLFILKGHPVAGGTALVAGRIQINGPWGGPAVEGVVWDALTGGQVTLLLNRIPDWGLAALSSDGRWLAYVSGDAVEMIDLAAAERTVRRLPAADTRALAFAPDGTRLATAHADGTVLVWETSAPSTSWVPADADRLWADLGSATAAAAWKAQWHLLAHPRMATELLTARAKPIAPLTDTLDLIARLDHPRFAVREAAARELARRGKVIEGDLRAARRTAATAEQRERLDGLLTRLDQATPPEGEELRGLRAVWLLERLGTAEAKKVLERLTGGATGSRVTAAATAALGRIR